MKPLPWFLAAGLLAACASTSDPSAGNLPVGTGLFIFTDSLDAVDTVALDTAYVQGPVSAPAGATPVVAGFFLVRYDFGLTVGLGGPEFATLPGTATYPLGATGARSVFADLRWGGEYYRADSGSVAIRQVRIGVAEWTVRARLIDQNSPGQPAYRLVARMVAGPPAAAP